MRSKHVHVQIQAAACLLQLGQGPEVLVPQVLFPEPVWEESLDTEFDACRNSRKLRIVSHFRRQQSYSIS